ncbi:antirestriction protein ArdA [Cupriavidus taiwanensis]|uniref:antirestriction protein ArdA n=1 Tax=Cupriavidus taiwanensis TaxID=164546 RepID=UPI000E106598|nr:antirestriction protein ArdA [Cupriavidus taiwanensis]SPA50628.1 conserved protein of unknown function [Cupriavidus taiwanensis]
MTTEITHADILDLRDITDRVEDLESQKEDAELAEDSSAAMREWDASEEAHELSQLLALLDELRGYGGNHQWRGDWYPDILIAEDHFQDYAQELAEDCGMVTKGAQWPNNCIDWEQAARELKMDYTYVRVTLGHNGQEGDYYYR